MRRDIGTDSVVKQNEGVNLTFVSNTHSASSMFYVLLISISHAYHSQPHHIPSCIFSLKEEEEKKRRPSEREFDDWQYSAACVSDVAALPLFQ
jgi:hypothetical protein